MGLNALFGRSIDLGIENSFIKGIGDELAPGDSALFMLMGETPVETVAQALNQFGGNLYHTNLSKEAADILVQASQHEPIAEAIENAAE
jgi:uncharacterized membrane protein